MNKSTGILVIDNSSGITGAFRSLTNITDSLSISFKFIFVFPNKELVERMSSEGKEAYYIPFLELHRSWKIILYIPRLIINSISALKLIRTHQLNAIHVNDLYNMIGVMLKILNPKLKLIYHVRLLPGSYAAILYKYWVKLVLKYSDKVVCVSDTVYKALPHSTKKTVIYDAIATPLPLDKSIKINKFIFLYPGNFIEGKGQHYAIEAYYKSLPMLGASKLIFVGGDLGKRKNQQYLKRLKNKVESLRLSDRILFEDFAENMSELYFSAQVVINFSESESFSMVCLEALLHKVPVIATRCGGPEEIISHEINGLLVDNRNVKQMAEAMVTLYENTALREQMEKATELVNHKFSLANSSQQLAEVYYSI